MELLTFIGQAARRRDDFVERAERLANSTSTLEKLEEEMEGRTEALGRKLREGKITFSEFKRAAAEDTLVSSLAATVLGSQGRSKLIDTAYAEAMGQMRYLWVFFEDIQKALSTGKIKYGSEDFDEAEETEEEILDVIPASALSPEPGKSIPATWDGVRQRLRRYLVTPAYRWYNAGALGRRQELGAREMRRVARRDRMCCQDCLSFDAMGWRPIGTLPVPGTRCQCLDRCRCRLDYR